MRFVPPEALFQVGTLVRARPRGSNTFLQGKITQIKTGLNSDGKRIQLYSIRFPQNAGSVEPKEAREIKQAHWYQYTELEYMHHPITGKSSLSYEQRTIHEVHLGSIRVVTWYYSPFPHPYTQLKELFICPFCMRYIRKQTVYTAHIQACEMKHPPGLKIYDDGLLAVYEVDGRLNKLFCQCLCLFSKLFLDSKTLFYDTDVFLFYIMTVRTEVLDEELNLALNLTGADIVCSCSYTTGETLVGYFSKEKYEWNILACILTFPCYQRMGIGALLIDFAYLLGQVENRQAGPEEPLSKLGLIGFTSYWSNKVLEYLLQHVLGANINELVRAERNKLVQNPSQSGVQLSADTSMELSQMTATTDFDDRDPSISTASSRTLIEDIKIVTNKKSERVDLAHICEHTGLLKKHAMEGLHRLPYLRFRNTDSFDVTCTNLESLLKHYLKKECSKTGRLLCHKLHQKNLHWDAYTTMYRRRDRIL